MSQQTLFHQVLDYVTRRGIRYEPVTEEAVTFVVRGKNGAFNALIQVRSEDEQIMVYSVSPVKAPAERRPEMALFLALANYGIFIGNFELDMNDGEVRYKASHDLAKQPFADDILANLIKISVGAYDQYAPGIKAVAEGLSAPEAIRQVEG